jgi:hypothetical protein
MNERHPLDIISLIFGILFLGISVPVLLLDTPVNLDARWVLPATVIVIGAVVLWSAIRPRSRALPDPTSPGSEDL